MSRQYSIDDLQLVDPLEAVRKLGLARFTNRKFNRTEMTAMIVEAALLCGSDDVHVQALGEWVYVSSMKDWLIDEHGDVSAQAFARVQSYSAGGPNSMRPEVLLTVFAKSAITGADGVLTVIKEDPRDLASLNRPTLAMSKRVVAFTAHDPS